MSHRSLASLSTLAALLLAAACGDPPIDESPDARPATDAAPVRYEILHTRWVGDGAQLAVASLDGKVLPLRWLRAGTKGVSHVSVSPDGTRIAFMTFDQTAGVWALIVRPLDVDGAEDRVLAYAADAARPAWSPDGRSIAYVSYDSVGDNIYIVSVDGGAPRPLTRLERASECTAPQWSPDGKEIAYATRFGVAVVPSAGGDARALVPDGDATWTCEPRWSPDGQAIAFAQGAGQGAGSIRRIARAGGDAVVLAPMTGGIPAGQVRWSHDGTQLAFVDFDADKAQAALRVVPAAGGTPMLIDHLASGVAGGHPTWSPDDRSLLYVRQDEGASLSTIPAAGGTRTKLGLHGASIEFTNPIWLETPIVR